MKRGRDEEEGAKHRRRGEARNVENGITRYTTFQCNVIKLRDRIFSGGLATNIPTRPS